jgi:hypothetical protein
MVSELLNRHPDVLSLSEFFQPLGPEAFVHRRPDGRTMWRLLSEQSPALRAMLKDGIVVDEMLYPLGAANARYRAQNIPPIAMVTLPHLTENPDTLFDELRPLISALPAQPLTDQYRSFFSILAEKFGRKVWVERSGGSLMIAAKLLRLFPEARVIHVYRDGRDTALSMNQHHNFRVLVGAMKMTRRFGIDPARDFLASCGRHADVWVQKLLFPRLDVRALADGVTLADLGAYWSQLILTSRSVFAGLGSDRLFELKFEDLQAEPGRKLREMIRFIDPSLADESWLAEVEKIPRPTRSRFPDLPPEEQRALAAAVAPGLQALGYAQ